MIVMVILVMIRSNGQAD